MSDTSSTITNLQAHETAKASILLQVISIALMILAVLASTPAKAEQWSLLVNGKAIHLDQQEGVDYNEENWGAGVQYDFNMTQKKWYPFVNASFFNDSNRNLSYYAGGGAMRRFSFGDKPDSLHLDAGVVAFVMVRKDFHDGKPFPGVLPAVSLGTDRVALNLTYIPKVDPKMVPILFLQLKIGLN